MRGTIDGAGVELAYEEHGAGPGVLLVHDLGVDRRSLAPVAAALAERARVVAYDRRGYGASGAPEPYVATTVHEQAEDAVALLDALGIGQAVLAAEGFGALVALDLLLRHGARVTAAALLAPTAYGLVPGAAAALSARRAELEDHLRAGAPARGVAAWRAAVGRPGGETDVPWSAFAADVAGLASLPLARGALRAVAVPTIVLADAGAPAVEREAAAALAGLLPAARLEHHGDLARATLALLAAAPVAG